MSRREIAQSIGWPLWGIPHEFEGDEDDAPCGNCGRPLVYELHRVPGPRTP